LGLRVSMVPMSPQGMPEALRTDSMRYVVVVFPLVPVTPIVFRERARGNSRFRIRGRAAFVSLTVMKDAPLLRSAWPALQITRYAPRPAASSMNRCPSVMLPERAMKASPGVTRLESARSAPKSTSGPTSTAPSRALAIVEAFTACPPWWRWLCSD